MICLSLYAAPAFSQDQPPDDAQAKPEMIRFNFPDNTNLKVLTDFVAQRLKLNIIYDDKELASRNLTIKAPVEVPLDSVRDLLDGALRVNSLALKKTDVPGTLRVVKASNLAAVPGKLTRQGDPNVEGEGSVVLRVFGFEHLTATRAGQLIEPYLFEPGATSQVIAEQNLLIVNNYADSMPLIEQVIKLIDQPVKAMSFKAFTVNHYSATEMKELVEQVLKGQSEAQGTAGLTRRVSIIAEKSSNRLVVYGPDEQLKSIEGLVASLDVQVDVTTEVYRLKVADVERVNQVVQSILGQSTSDRLYRSVVDEDTNELVVTTTPTIHKQIKEIIDKLDELPPAEESPIRFYKLDNAKAEDLVQTLIGVFGSSDQQQDRTGQDEPLNPNAEFDTSRNIGARSRSLLDRAEPGAPLAEEPDAGANDSKLAADLADARVIADTPTNTVIVVAKPSIQPIYEQMIKKLDVRLPQVVLQATIVIIDTTDDFRLGVEFLSNEEAAAGGSVLNFTQFGLSDFDTATNSLALAPATGFNAALLSSEIADVVLQALQRDSHSTVLTSPQILVNDNEQGTLASEDEEPIETNVLTGSGASQATFGGYATAGTRVQVTPSISEGDYLKIAYDINVSSFSSVDSSSTLPPARQSNQLTSVATIPDGHTIIVGGLTREVTEETIESVPYLGQIPVLKYALSSQSSDKRQITTYIFLKSKILRDDKFEDLKLLSGTAAGKANLPSSFPRSEPVEIR